MKAIGYIRVSTQEQATKGVSMEMQRAKIEAWGVRITILDKPVLKAVEG